MKSGKVLLKSGTKSWIYEGQMINEKPYGAGTRTLEKDGSTEFSKTWFNGMRNGIVVGK